MSKLMSKFDSELISKLISKFNSKLISKLISEFDSKLISKLISKFFSKLISKLISKFVRVWESLLRDLIFLWELVHYWWTSGSDFCCSTARPLTSPPA